MVTFKTVVFFPTALDSPSKFTFVKLRVLTDSGIDIVYDPNLSVCVPYLPSALVTLAPSIGAPLSLVTLPVLVRFWAAACSMNTNTADKVKINFLICILVYVDKYKSHSL